MPAIAQELATSDNQPVHLPAIRQGAAEDGFLTTEQALQAELDHLIGPRADGDKNSFAKRADDARLAALCLSGGGIRSATFCLGALQALAARRMLTQFHYLSTVSGGGFAGGWLQVFIREKGGLDAAQVCLAENGNKAFDKLREYTNYLTPEVGALSKDTWAGVVLYIRNLILNWLVILPLLLFIPLGLIFYRTAMETLVVANLPWWVPLAAGFAALSYGTFSACTWLPSHQPVQDGKQTYETPKGILRGVIVPTCLWALCLSVALRAVFVDGLADHRAAHVPRVMAVAYVATAVIAYAGSALWKRWGKDPALDLYRKNAGAWMAASLVSAGIIFVATEYGLAALDGNHPATYDPAAGQAATFIAVVAPLGFIVAHLMQSVLFIGLRRKARLPELDREWVARADGQILLYGLCWTMLASCCLLLPLVLDPFLPGFRHHPRALPTAVTALVSGPIAAWLGKQAFARAQSLVARGKLDVVLLFLLRLAAVVFGISLLALLARGLNQILGLAQVWSAGCSDLPSGEEALPPVCRFPDWHEYSPLVLQIGIAGLLVCAVLRFGSVNVNRFSMHGIYRNRLTRGFLGSARESRNPDPFTNFDEQDSPRMTDLRSGRHLFPIVNMTLNLTDVVRTAWAERKAAPFTATPLACGSAILENKDQAPAADPKKPPPGAYVPTAKYGGMDTRDDRAHKCAGPLLGGLLTISGAAVSPNWGYHSSRLVAFLMTCFNVRLGAWMPNPGFGHMNLMRYAMPRNSVVALANELMGQSTDTRQAVYLSDGGHFENLGLYEALRRRCARIVVIDAGQDEDCTFFDLGNAIRKAKVDGLASIRMGEMRIVPRSATDQARASALGYARGSITYPDARDPASLIYIKPTYLDGIPAEIRAYGAANPSFPHESTAKQWFSESQFESYRALGYFQVSQMFGSQTTSLTEWAAYLGEQMAPHGRR